MLASGGRDAGRWAVDGAVPAGSCGLAPLACDFTPSDFWEVHPFGSVSSTNDVVKDALLSGCAEGFCACALRQTGGYGRQGRAWSSPVGGLYASFAFRPQVPVWQAPTLSLALSLAAYRCAARVASPEGLCLKWPNDVLCDAGKLCGISLEALAGGVCVGIGLNAYRPAEAQPVPGKYQVAYLFDGKAGQDLNPSQRRQVEALLIVLLQELESVYAQWNARGFAGVRAAYEERLAYVGCRATLEYVDGSPMFAGVIEGVDEAGRLLVRSGDELRAVSSGEVHVR